MKWPYNKDADALNHEGTIQPLAQEVEIFREKADYLSQQVKVPENQGGVPDQAGALRDDH
ncbi:hypothetical protein N7533_000266 [Penicillium manginii]|jgi:hypothetical protein|uniref:uncharacterized protein n=1 Tax=Penicillium manginii TaxID=203109 RepID=UPI00254943C1|nr:uncharacterized protein N7533_000266 [Penicillium manginii]KAJ5767683.1 hypothetical protein N7533_000266 [Penicillium manginii]